MEKYYCIIVYTKDEPLRIQTSPIFHDSLASSIQQSQLNISDQSRLVISVLQNNPKPPIQSFILSIYHFVTVFQTALNSRFNHHQMAKW